MQQPDEAEDEDEDEAAAEKEGGEQEKGEAPESSSRAARPAERAVRRAARTSRNLARLRTAHAGWAEAEARVGAALGARAAARACDAVLGGKMCAASTLEHSLPDPWQTSGRLRCWKLLKASHEARRARRLPGPALQAVADALMLDAFRLWPPVTRPRVAEW